MGYRSKGTIEYEPSISLSVSAKHKVNVKKEKVNRFKRRKTSRSELQRESVNVNIDETEDKEAETLKNEENKSKEENKGLIGAPAEFEGFLLRKIGHSTDKIGEKIYFRLILDQLEFSKIEEMIDENNSNAIRQMHAENILGSISIEHIKSVQMSENDDEFVLVFNDHNSNSDWLLTTTKTDKGNRSNGWKC